MAKLVFNNMNLHVEKGKISYDLREKYASKILEGVVFDIEHLHPGEEAKYIGTDSKVDFRGLAADKIKGITGLEVEIGEEVYPVRDSETFMSLPDEADGGKVISALIYEVAARIMNSSYLTQDEVKN